MDLKFLVIVFGTVFIAEIADKTQLVTMLYASDGQHSKMMVFLGASIALCLSSAIAVFVGASFSNWIDPKMLGKIAGVAFILVGIWTLAR